MDELLAEGADPNMADYDKRTPLHIACSDGHVEVRTMGCQWHDGLSVV